MARGDCGLKGVRAESANERFGAFKRSKAVAYEEMIPAGAILIEEQERFTGRTDTRVRARSLNFHERDEAVDFRLVGSEAGENAAEAESIFAKRRTHPVFTGSGGVAFVENKVDNFEDGRKSSGEIRAAWDFEGNARFGERAFGADEAPGERWVWDGKGPSGPLRVEAAEEA